MHIELFVDDVYSLVTVGDMPSLMAIFGNAITSLTSASDEVRNRKFAASDISRSRLKVG
jgi:hypothetical protein